MTMRDTRNYPPRRGRVWILLALIVTAVVACLAAWQVWARSNRRLVNRMIAEAEPVLAAVLREGAPDGFGRELGYGDTEAPEPQSEENEQEEEYMRAGRRYVMAADWARALASAGRVEQAHAVAAFIEDDFFSAMAYARIASACAETKDADCLVNSAGLAQKEAEKAQPKRQVMVFAELAKAYSVHRDHFEQRTLDRDFVDSKMYDLLESALANAKTQSDSGSRSAGHNKYTFKAYLHLANGLAEAGKGEAAARAFDSAASELNILNCNEDKVLVVVEYVKGVIAAGRSDFAVRAAEEIASDRCYFFSTNLSGDEGFDHRRGFEWTAVRLIRVTQELAGAGKAEETEKVARMAFILVERMSDARLDASTRQRRYESLLFSQLAQSLAAVGRVDSADRAARASLEVLRGDDDGREQVYWPDPIYAKVAGNLAGAGKLEEALSIMRKKAEGAARAESRPTNWYFDTLWTARRIAGALAEANRHEEARVVMQKYRETVASLGLSHEGDDGRSVEYGLPAITVKVLARRGETERAAALLAQVEREDVLDRALTDFASETSRLAVEAARAGRLHEAKAKLTQAYAAAGRLHNERLKSATLSVVAKGWAALGDYHRAHEVCEELAASDRLGVYTFILNSYLGVQPKSLSAWPWYA